MGKKSKSKRGRGAYSLAPFDNEDPRFVQVVIETPRGSRNKYAYDPEQGIYALKKVLPAGMVFPYDFGFVPSTKAADGDPIDVLVLLEDPVTVGCLTKCRLIGALLGEQVDAEHPKPVRNDRLLAIEQANHAYAGIEDIQDLSDKLLKEIEQFFVNYHRLEGGEYKPIGRKGPRAARELLEKAIR